MRDLAQLVEEAGADGDPFPRALRCHQNRLGRIDRLALNTACPEG